MTEEELRNNVERVRASMAEAALRGHRQPSDVQLVAVTKTVDTDRMKMALAAGIADLGENYVQEAKAKVSALRANECSARFHFIGHLQRNKAKDAVALFDVIHTVDRLELAREIDKEARKAGKNQQVLWQVNISGEKTKSGAEAPSLEPLLREALKFENLNISGLMSIGSYVSPSESDELRRAEFRELRKLRSALENYLGVGLPDLSMGMSHDFELAIEEGATFVRVGSAIFGARS